MHVPSWQPYIKVNLNSFWTHINIRFLSINLTWLNISPSALWDFKISSSLRRYNLKKALTFYPRVSWVSIVWPRSVHIHKTGKPKTIPYTAWPRSLPYLNVPLNFFNFWEGSKTAEIAQYPVLMSYTFLPNLMTAMPCSMKQQQEAQWSALHCMTEETGSPLSHKIQWQTTQRLQIRVGEGSTLGKGRHWEVLT